MENRPFREIAKIKHIPFESYEVIGIFRAEDKDFKVISYPNALPHELLLFPLLLFLLRKTITLDLFCLLHLMSCILVYFTQAFILVKRGIRFGRTAAINAVICCSSWIFYFLF